MSSQQLPATVQAAWEQVQQELTTVFAQEYTDTSESVNAKLESAMEVLERLTQPDKVSPTLKLKNISEMQKKQLPLAGAIDRALRSEPKWIVYCLGLSAVGGILALTAAVLHAVKQVNQLHAPESDDASAAPSAPAAAPVIHIDHYTPMMLALMSLLRWPHSLYIKDRKMLCFQVANVLVWGGITVYVWVNDPHPSLPHIDL